MNKSKRLLFQILLWLLLWIILSVGQQVNNRLIIHNAVAFTFQVLLIFGLIYFVAPKLLFQKNKKKLFYFVLISIISIVICSFIASNIFSPPNEPPRPPQNILYPIQRRGPITVPRFLINILMLSISYILASLIETFLFIKKKEEEFIVTKNENLQTELKLLKSQINPHFLFNALNNIYSLSIIQSDKTSESISYLSEMLRYVLYDCEQNLVGIDKEIRYITNYLKLFSLKRSKPFNIATNFNIENKSIQLAPMLLIPFVENALKHSNIEQEMNGFLDINLTVTDSIIFTVKNNMPTIKVIKDAIGGIGLQNVRKRLELLYPNQHQLDIENNNDSFVVTLQLNSKKDA